MSLASILAIVEGDGEVQAVPVLLRRIALEVAAGNRPRIQKPIRVHRSKVIKDGVLEGYVGLAAQRVGAGGGVLILLDANGDCPARLGPALLERARAARPDRRIEVVIAKCEYEAWFLASIQSVAGSRTLSREVAAPPAAESVRGAKEWLSQRMQVPYRPITERPALTARFDMVLAGRRAPSFDKMWRAFSALLHRT